MALPDADLLFDKIERHEVLFSNFLEHCVDQSWAMTPEGSDIVNATLLTAQCASLAFSAKSRLLVGETLEQLCTLLRLWPKDYVVDYRESPIAHAVWCCQRRHCHGACPGNRCRGDCCRRDIKKLTVTSVLEIFVTYLQQKIKYDDSNMRPSCSLETAQTSKYTC